MNIFKKSDDKHHLATIDELRHRIDSANMPSEVQRIADRELEMLSKTNPVTAEYSIGLTYIDYLLGLPWNKKTADNLDLERAERILNERHYGLHDVKERIIEHLAVKILVI